MNKINTFIIDAINTDGYLSKPLTSEVDKLRFLRATFYAEKREHIERQGEHKTLIDFMQGLASSFNIPYTPEDIEQASKHCEIAMTQDNEGIEYYDMDKFYDTIATHTIELWDAYQVDQPIKSINIQAREWFDKANGVSYFSARIYIDENEVIIPPYENGYNDYYIDAANICLSERGYINNPERANGGREQLSIYCRDNNIHLVTAKVKTLKRELDK